MGVFLIAGDIHAEKLGLPHARGGVSTTHLASAGRLLSSPRPWGCFSPKGLISGMWKVFPTPVGVFLDGKQLEVVIGGLPHARGGVSGMTCAFIFLNWSSPRPWGCFFHIAISVVSNFVFPTPVGVFLRKDWRRQN